MTESPAVTLAAPLDSLPHITPRRAKGLRHLGLNRLVDLIEHFPRTYQFEAAEVMSCLRAGRLESRLMPLDETLSILRTLDAIRAQWGLRYPMD